MGRLNKITDDKASFFIKKLFKKVEEGLGKIPVLFRYMANSEAIFEGFLTYNSSLANAKLDPKYAKMVILATSEYNDCEYCVRAHTQMAKDANLLNDEQCLNARKFIGIDEKSNVMLKFVKKVLETKGYVSDDDIKEVRDAGFSDAEIVEMLGAMNIAMMTNYLAHVADVECDFPEVPKVE